MPKLTKRKIDALEPRATEYFASDSDLPGFGVRVAPSGRKAFARRSIQSDSERDRRSDSEIRVATTPFRLQGGAGRSTRE
jgi:hypothetical protein